jgi:hypothetical protein
LYVMLGDLHEAQDVVAAHLASILSSSRLR